GWNCSMQDWSRVSHLFSHSPSRMMVLPARPWRVLLRADRALPQVVAGPLERRPLRREASICASVLMTTSYGTICGLASWFGCMSVLINERYFGESCEGNYLAADKRRFT